MTTLKTVEEVATDLWAIQHSGLVKDGVKFPNNFDGIGAAYGGYARIIESITQDRQAAADVLCALLDESKPCYGDARPNEIELAEFDSYVSAIRDAQDIIRAVLSNEDL